MNLRPPSVTASTQTSAFTAIVSQSPVMPNARMSLCTQSVHSFSFPPSSTHCALKVSEHDSLSQPPAAHSEERSRPQKSSRAQRCLEALAPGYLKGTVVRGHPVVWYEVWCSVPGGGSTYCMNLVVTHGISTAFRGGVHLFTPSTAIGSVPLIVYQVTQIRTDCIHCRETVGAGSVVLKIVPVTGAAFSGITMDHLFCAPLFQYPLLVVVCCGHGSYRIYRRYSKYSTVGAFSRVWINRFGFQSCFFAPENLVSRDEFGHPVLRQPVHSPHSG